jgi:hypothetical protein
MNTAPEITGGVLETHAVNETAQLTMEETVTTR